MAMVRPVHKAVFILTLVLVCLCVFVKYHVSPARSMLVSGGGYYSDKTKLVSALAMVSSFPPPVSINTTCHPPPLPALPRCEEDPGLSGQILHNPRRLVVMMLFAFEADTLEIALHDWLDLVDFVFLVEATRTHKGVSMDTLHPVTVCTACRTASHSCGRG